MLLLVVEAQLDQVEGLGSEVRGEQLAHGPVDVVPVVEHLGRTRA